MYRSRKVVFLWFRKCKETNRHSLLLTPNAKLIRAGKIVSFDSTIVPVSDLIKFRYSNTMMVVFNNRIILAQKVSQGRSVNGSRPDEISHPRHVLDISRVNPPPSQDQFKVEVFKETDVHSDIALGDSVRLVISLTYA